MKIRALCAGLVLIALAACAGGGHESPTRPTTDPTGDPSATWQSSQAVQDPAETAFIAALNDIDPEIVGMKEQRSIIDRGRDQCQSIQDNPNDRARLVDLTNKRFTAPTRPEGFGLATAERILAEVHGHLCPQYPMASPTQAPVVAAAPPAGTAAKVHVQPAKPKTPALPKPTPAKKPALVHYVTPGAFCSHLGEVGHSKTGKLMVCRTASDGRLRWKS